MTKETGKSSGETPRARRRRTGDMPYAVSGNLYLELVLRDAMADTQRRLSAALKRHFEEVPFSDGELEDRAMRNRD